MKRAANLRIFPSFKRHRSLSSIPETVAGEENLSDTMNLFNQPPPPGVSPRRELDKAQISELLTSLQIPDIIKDLKTFEGDPHNLHEFIANVEEILHLVSQTDGTSYGLMLLRAIRNKIEGKANRLLTLHKTPLNWDEIKHTLINNYADKRTESSLLTDLNNLSQGNKTIEEFHNEIIEIQSALNNTLYLSEHDHNVIRASRNWFTDMCLNAFLRGIREPLGATIRAMRPHTLATALSYCIKEQDIQYQKRSFRNQNPRYNNNYSPYPRQYNTNRALPIPQFNANRFQNTFRQNYNNYQTNNNTAYIPRNNFNSNPFNNSRSIMPPKSEPASRNNSTMSRFSNKNNSTTSRFTNRNFGNMEHDTELNNLQTMTIQNDNYQPEHEICNIEETPNFHMLASGNQQEGISKTVSGAEGISALLGKNYPSTGGIPEENFYCSYCRVSTPCDQ